MNVQDADTVGVRILDAALQLLRSPGPPAVTMQSVTEATGIAKKRCTGATEIGVRYLRPPWSNWPQPVIDPQASPERRLGWAIAQSIDVVVNGIGPVALRRC